MWPFRKKKNDTEIMTIPEVVMEPAPCKHKWKDFDWYVTWNYKPHYDRIEERRLPYGELSIKVYEPYVCIWCKERHDKLLRSIDFDKIDEQEAKERFDSILKNPHVRPREEIEDEIEDMKHDIDREYLAIVETVCPHRLGVRKTH